MNGLGKFDNVGTRTGSRSLMPSNLESEFVSWSTMLIVSLQTMR